MKFKKNIIVSFAILNLLFLFVSCSKNTEEKTSCEVNADCKANEYCSKEECHVACVNMECGRNYGFECGECVGDQICDEHQCRDSCIDMTCGQDNGIECGVCGDKQICEDNNCKDVCVNMTCGLDNEVECGSCENSQVCENNNCKDLCVNMTCGEYNGVECGTCSDKQICENNNCKDVCINMTCGQDNGVDCGVCGDKQICENNSCKDICINMTCGQDNGVECGTCTERQICENNSCKDICVNMTCGVDNGVSCGSCSDEYVCLENNCLNRTVIIPAGNFMMGCDASVQDDCRMNEVPYHEVSLSAYEIDLLEVTVAEFRKCVEAGICKSDYFRDYSESSNCNYNSPSLTEDNPMNCTNWYAAKEYCEWVGKRLPTEAEWENAARGTDDRMYPWGNELYSCTYAIYDSGRDGCGRETTWEVGSLPEGRSFYGLYNMAGNVMEWVNDYYDEEYYEDNLMVDPQGPATGTKKGLRGISWMDNETRLLRVYTRARAVIGVSGGSYGFRCAKSVSE